MKNTSRYWGLIACLMGATAFGCGEESDAIPDGKCPAQPLYRWVSVDAGHQTSDWVRSGLDGKPLTADELKAINDAYPNCLTPAGHAISLDAGK